MKLARLTLSAPSVCMLLVFLAWILSTLCIHFSHFAASIFRKSQSKQFRHFPKQTVEIVPTRTTMNVSERSYLSSMRLSPHLDKNAHYSGWVYRSIYIYIGFRSSHSFSDMWQLVFELWPSLVATAPREDWCLSGPSNFSNFFSHFHGRKFVAIHGRIVSRKIFPW